MHIVMLSALPLQDNSEIGAYRLTGRTNFNGHFSNDIVTISGDSPAPTG